MKFFYILIALTHLFIIQSNAQFFSISGSVIDSVSGKPIEGAVVFIHQTTRFVYTDSTGNFKFDSLPGASVNVVCYKKAFQLYEYAISKLAANTIVKFSITKNKHEDIATLPDSTLTKQKKQWQDIFLKQFLGSSDNAYACEVANTGAIVYDYSAKENKLTVRAYEPILIFNESTGYLINCFLDDFTIDFNNNSTHWSGYLFFKPLTTKSTVTEEEWKYNRESTFQGSFMHFIRSAINDKLKQEGFEVSVYNRLYEYDANYKQMLVNAENKGTGFIKNENGDIVKVNYIDVPFIIKTPKDWIIQKDSAAGYKLLLQQNRMVRVVYKRKLAPTANYTNASPGFVNLIRSDYPVSLLIKSSEKDIIIEKKGNCYPENSLLFLGYWHWLGLADMLPLNYMYRQ